MLVDEMKKSFHVTIDVIQSHHYVVDDANSPEEAEDTAQEWLDDGEEGTVDSREVWSMDTYPVENKEEIS
jgi:hypothetical protein